MDVITRPKSRITYDLETQEKIFKMYDEFKTMNEVGKELGISRYMCIEMRARWRESRNIGEGSVIDHARAYPKRLAKEWDKAIDEIKQKSKKKGNDTIWR